MFWLFYPSRTVDTDYIGGWVEPRMIMDLVTQGNSMQLSKIDPWCFNY